MGMLLLATVYVFSIILAVFLVGLAAGSAAASWLIRAHPRRISRWASASFCWRSGIAWTAVHDRRILPFWSDAILTTTNPWHMFLLDLKRCALAILPPAFLWGASFPLACAAAVRSPDEDPGRVAGGIYAANTLGAHRGRAGGQPGADSLDRHAAIDAHILLLSALSGLIVLVPSFEARKSARCRRWAFSASMLLAALLAWGVPEFPAN